MTNINRLSFKNFKFPPQGEAEAFWEAQQILFQEKQRFADYFRILINKVGYISGNTDSKKAGKIDSYVYKSDFIIKLISKIINNFLYTKKKESFSFDILLNTAFHGIRRESEQRFVKDFIKSCSSLDLKLCILFENQEIASYFIDQKDIFFTIIASDFPRSKISKLFIKKISNYIAREDFCYIQDTLLKNNLSIITKFKSNLISLMKERIYQYIQLLLISREIDYEVAVLRCIRDKYSWAINHTSQSKKKMVIGFQHGVVGHTLELPITVNRYLTFGNQSNQLLRDLNKEFEVLFKEKRMCSDFCEVGQITDEIKIQENNFPKRSVLIIDQTVKTWGSIEFYGLEKQIEATERLITAILDLQELYKVIVRPHPDAEISPFWQEALDIYPDKFEISHPHYPLTDDVNKSSIAVGLFSGGLITCASSGLPTYFLTHPEGFFTPDIDCFKSPFICDEKTMLTEIKKLLSDEEYYLLQRKKCLLRSERYYKNNQRTNIDSKFIKDFIFN